MLTLEKKEELIQNYWSTVPLIKTVSSNFFKSQPTRDKILEILRMGIFEPKFESNTELKRHALSVQEIRDELKTEYSSTKTVQNIYFHINKLVESGFVQEVTTLKKGKHNITYYGRTAKLFLFGHDKEKEFSDKKQNVLEEISKIASKISNTKQTVIEDLFDEVIEVNTSTMNAIDTWIENNSELLVELNSDIKLIYEILMDVLKSSEKSIELSKRLSEILKFHIDKPELNENNKN